MTALLLLALAAAPATNEPLLRDLIGETALRQVQAPDVDWLPSQRDCAGLVRHAYRRAFKTLEPARLKEGLWSDSRGKASPFADAETLLSTRFVRLGRGENEAAQLQSGDLLAFRQASAGGEPVYHLMLVVRPRDRAQAETMVVYHPGSLDSSVRLGRLRELARDAPVEWRPLPGNTAFLGYFRFKEWTR